MQSELQVGLQVFHSLFSKNFCSTCAHICIQSPINKSKVEPLHKNLIRATSFDFALSTSTVYFLITILKIICSADFAPNQCECTCIPQRAVSKPLKYFCKLLFDLSISRIISQFFCSDKSYFQSTSFIFCHDKFNTTL